MRCLADDKALQEKLASRKKTKSRNGCQRCKVKRLKCDETAPFCLQCKKRNVPCPGYEKTLKWSTKYEVLQPVRFEPACTGAYAAETAQVQDVELPPDVVNGFEALAAALNTKKEKSNSDSTSHDRDDSAERTPPAQAIALNATSSPEESASPPENQAYLPDPLDILDITSPPDLLDSTFDLMQPQDLPLSDGLDYSALAMLEDFDMGMLPDANEDVEETIVSPSLDPESPRSLLLDYYRVASPTSTCMADDIESALIQHYFRDVCALFSGFDSLLNPFRTTIGRIFQQSSSIYYAIQSMAAAHLANTSPDMTQVGKELQRKAWDNLQVELPLVQNGSLSSSTVFLSIMMLGMTTCWHESGALGEEYLALARSLILPKLLQSGAEREETKRETQFFEQSLIYWEMLMGFVTQEGMPRGEKRKRTAAQRRRVRRRTTPAARDKDGKIVPHPWTGISATVQMLFAEVGRLIRHERLLHNTGTSPDDMQRQDNLLQASYLEEDLLAISHPEVSDLADPGDSRTSRRDFVVLAETYRCAGLLELYRVFPALLRRRLGASTSETDDSDSAPSPSTNLPCWSPSPLLQTDSSLSPDSTYAFAPPPRFNTPHETTDTLLFLNALALHILSLLESIPPTSGTCCLQPILFVAAASELRFVSSVDYFDVYANDGRVLSARRFFLERMGLYKRRLPGKPVERMVKLVREVWGRLDEWGVDGGKQGEVEGRETEVFWIDVMVEKGWFTVMG